MPIFKLSASKQCVGLVIIFCPEMRKISPAATYISKIFPGRKHRTPAYRGREGREMKGLKGSYL